MGSLHAPLALEPLNRVKYRYFKICQDYSMFALIDAYRAGLLKWKYWPSNIIAGIIVGIVALPLAMAFAIASGAKPEQGLYTAIIAGICVGIFGGSRVQIAGPTAAFIVILAGITAKYGIVGMQAATFMAGFILLFMGLSKLGTIIKFIPESVIAGFTSGIAVTIFVGQWSNFFGLNAHIPLNASFYHRCVLLIQALPHLNMMTTLIGCLSLAFMLITPLLFKRIPGPLVATVLTTLVLVVLPINGVATLGSAFGGIPEHLPTFTLPYLSFSMFTQLIGAAFTIALLGAIESLLSAAAADSMANTRHDANQELVGQGLANIISPLFNGIAATGAIARTATNIRNGGTSPIASIVHALLILLLIIILAPLASYIPLCALAAILFVVSYNIADFGNFFEIIRCAPKYDVIILIVTFLLTIFTNLVIAVNIGVILGMLFFIRRMYQSITIEKQHAGDLQDELAFEKKTLEALSKDTIIYTIQGPYFFGIAEKVEHALIITHGAPKNIIFRFKYMTFIDMTGLHQLKSIIHRYKKHDVNVYICEANSLVHKKLAKNGILDLIVESRTFNTLTDAVSIIKQSL